MLAGLIFATEDAGDRPGTLAATLPFGGMTLLEYQARLLVGAGVAQILVAVTRMTPALLGAVSRAAKRGVPIDVVRSAQEAAAKAHPLASIVVIADGLVTTDDVVERIAGEGKDAVVVTQDASVSLERLDARHCWAGIARTPAQRLSDIAAFPADYDFQSTLLRAIVQAGAEQIALPASAIRAGHGVERDGAALASRSNAVLAALTERRTSWADRHVFTRTARLLLPKVVERALPGWLLTASGVALAGMAAVLILAGWPWGALIALPGVAAFATGAALSALRGEERRAQVQERLIAVSAALVILTLGAGESLLELSWDGLILALVTVAATAIGERTQARVRRWWGSPAGYLLLVTPFAVTGRVSWGLAAVAIYAFVTLAAAVESQREKP
ncbi:hypothetical protein [Sphingomonas turrisvirgatae]|uniref:Uncharacterized protein n=1 Tax=Sphingomonas turrisvirgatae TaxID=1888892 RepID=A0A1E3LXM8_9SPHN|nr:hypothetical protein [Sphingomonas turrisvirgatae]ODP37560.1 hypothetical protein BFL28_17395 [Sphingomonas turrisvirgatae]